jgi:hypothetical protein
MGLALWKLIVEGRATDEHWSIKIRTCKKRKRLQELKGESAEKSTMTSIKEAKRSCP